jgi:2,4-dienoyl-CoA reductase-like NADH-dependent reductase (Old Yellow Enzyme family)
VDIKSCHRYLISELLSAHTRDGKYGGTFENRVRFLLDTIDAVQAHVPEIDIAVRLNVYDAIPYPYGWGVAEGGVDPNPAEPQYLAKLLAGHGAKLINVTAGNPYYNPHVNRPYDIGPYVPPEHPLEGMARLLRFAHNMQNAVPDIPVVATGFTWPREHGAAIAAGCIENGWCAVAGFGRQAFAYPDFAHDILLHGGMDAGKCCITCTKCSEIMRFGGRSGCVVHDREVYLPIYKEVSAGKPSQVGTEVRSHII